MVERQYIRLSVEERIATITIDNPPANAFNRKALEELESTFDEVTEDPEVKAIIITGAGQFFVAGADVKEIYDVRDKPEEAEAFIRKGQRLFSKIEASKKPVIAAINGRYALGGGNELAMACHIRIAESGVRLGQPEINLGIMPGWGGTQRLPRIVGKGKALEMLLTGDPITAQEAYRIGLVDKVVPVGTVIREAKAIAKRIVSKSRIPIAAIIEAVNEGLEKDLQSGMDVEVSKFASLQESEDMEEGLRAFLEKRQPKFKDR
jgi:enoyl-CoA hydratase/carnithine racemase